MENFKSKFVTAEAAVAAAVKDGDWVDYGFGGGYPELMDRALAARCKGRRAIAVLNKEDLTAAPGVFDQTLLEGCFDRVVTLSATEPAARDTLAQAVDSLMGTAGLDPNAGALCSQRQLAAAVAARDALAGARQARADGFDLDAVGVCLDDALEALCRLTGEDAGEAVIDQVFSRFCVGK